MTPELLFAVGKISASVDFLELNVDCADLSIRHAKCADIYINANSPANWSIEENALFQIRAEGIPVSGSALEVIVPENFSGGLTINYEGGSKILVDYWHEGDLFIASYKGGLITCGHLTSLSSFVLQVTGAGDLDIESIETDSFVASKSGNGDLNIGSLETGSLLLNQSGCGKTSIASGGAQCGSIKNDGSGEVQLKGNFARINRSLSPSQPKAKIHVFE